MRRSGGCGPGEVDRVSERERVLWKWGFSQVSFLPKEPIEENYPE